MPILAGNHTVNTVADVNSRVRSIMNDNNAQLYPDGANSLLNAVRNAYNWLYGQVVTLRGQTFEAVISDIVYTASANPGTEQDLASIMPVNIYQPIAIYFRLNSSEEYIEVDRRQRLPSKITQPPMRVSEWERRGNTIFVIGASSNGLIRLRYRPLLGIVNLTTDPINIDNALEAIANRAAYELARARNQITVMASTKADAKEYAEMILDHLILDEQEIARRGQRFEEASVQATAYRDYVG